MSGNQSIVTERKNFSVDKGTGPYSMQLSWNPRKLGGMEGIFSVPMKG